MNVLDAPRQRRQSDAARIWTAVLVALLFEAALGACAFGLYELLTKVWP